MVKAAEETDRVELVERSQEALVLTTANLGGLLRKLLALVRDRGVHPRLGLERCKIPK